MFFEMNVSFSVMHVGAVAALLLRHHKNPTIQELLRRLDKEKLIGTLVYSDPTTGKEKATRNQRVLLVARQIHHEKIVLLLLSLSFSGIMNMNYKHEVYNVN